MSSRSTAVYSCVRFTLAVAPPPHSAAWASLDRWIHSSLRWSWTTAEVADLRQTLLVRLVELRAGPGEPHHPLTRHSPTELVGYVRRMLRAIEAERLPGRKAYRTLRKMVLHVTAAPLPTPAGLPVSLVRSATLQRDLVAAACAQLVADGVSRAPRPLLAALLARYELGASERPDPLETQEPNAVSPGADDVEAVETATRLADTFRRVASEKEVDAAMRLDESLSAVASACGLPTSTLKSRRVKAGARLAALARTLGASFEECRLALWCLSDPMAGSR